jgi:beta-galactosidase
MTAKRETTGPAAKLVLRVDRQEISADGEDVSMFAVEVRDAQDRTMPIANNQVDFRVTGQGKPIGVGNGDPTSHEPDKGSSYKAFNGYCMAIVQSTKTAGNITVEATSPGLTPASVTISTKAVTLRPQVAVWEREVPVGPGVTGLWRTGGGSGGRGSRGGGGGQVFTLRQSGGVLSGTVEGGGADGGETPVAIQDGKVDGANVSFRVGNATYTGTLKGDQLELQRPGGGAGGRGGRGAATAPAAPRPAIGPPPDGVNPGSAAYISSLTGGGGGRGAQTPAPLVLVRAKR